MMNFISKLFKKDTSSRLSPKDVKPGDFICVELSKALNGMASAECLNNDPKTKKMLLEVVWEGEKEEDNHTERLIVEYSSKVFKNFHLLNSDTEGSLKIKLQEAIEKECYEKAAEIREKIKNINKKS